MKTDLLKADFYIILMEHQVYTININLLQYFYLDLRYKRVKWRPSPVDAAFSSGRRLLCLCVVGVVGGCLGNAAGGGGPITVTNTGGS